MQICCSKNWRQSVLDKNAGKCVRDILPSKHQNKVDSSLLGIHGLVKSEYNVTLLLQILDKSPKVETLTLFCSGFFFLKEREEKNFAQYPWYQFV